MKIPALLVSAGALLALALAPAQDTKSLKGTVKLDGSSTVFPIAEAVAEEFSKAAPNVDVTVGMSGTGGGFKRFGAGEIDMSNASRAIKKSEVDACKAKQIEFIELPVAFDGLTIVVNTGNTWAKEITVEQLKSIFLAGSTARTWKDVDPSWPADAIKVFSPGTDSGTFDYFKEVVAGREGKIRADMSVSEDDNVLVRGVEGDRNAIGFFGYAYYAENKSRVRAVPVVNPATRKAVAPAPGSIEDGSYAPFSRPLFIYVNRASLDKPAAAAFARYALDHASELVGEVGYVKLPAAIIDRAKANLASRRTGSQFLDAEGKDRHGPLAEIYR